MTLGFHCMLPSFVTCNVCVKDREEKWPSYKVEYRFEFFRLFNKYNLKTLYFHLLNFLKKSFLAFPFMNACHI
jgi:hypothetical protein